MLLKAGANIHAETRSKETPLNLAARSGRYGIAEQLLNAKAIVDTTNSFGRTPLATAFYFGRQLVAQLLLANGARLSNVKPDIPIPSWAGGEVVRGIEEKNLVIKSLEASTRLLSERLESADGTITTLTRKVLDLSTQVEFQLQRANESEQRLQEVTTAFSALKAMLDQMRAEREPKHFMDQ
jgi:ankyrin repeat protein